MDLTTRLTELEEMVRDAKSMPLSSSALLNRDEVLNLIEDLKTSLPDEIKQARWVVKDREELLAKARRDAEAMVEQARAEQLRLASHEAVMQRAKDEAERIVQEAEEDARRLRLEAEDYVDAKLASFEATLERTIGVVQKGRKRLQAFTPEAPVEVLPAEPGLFDQDLM